jgi:hypothetical protein
MRMPDGGRLDLAVAVALTALVLLVLAGPALTGALREHLRSPANSPTDAPSTAACALEIGPIHAYCTASDGTLTPARSPR